MFRFIFILAAFVATSAKAELTQRDLRQIAYDGDIARIEATFADLHKQSLDGTISADKLRSLVSGLVVSHPDILDFTQAWQESQPRSPYVNAVRAFQFSEQSFHLRGDRLWRDTPVIARDAFFRLQQSAMEMAVQAYEAAPDFIPASDAVFVVNRTTHVLDSAGLDQLRRDVLSKSHDFGSLRGHCAPQIQTGEARAAQRFIVSAANLRCLSLMLKATIKRSAPFITSTKGQQTRLVGLGQQRPSGTERIRF